MSPTRAPPGDAVVRCRDVIDIIISAPGHKFNCERNELLQLLSQPHVQVSWNSNKSLRWDYCGILTQIWHLYSFKTSFFSAKVMKFKIFFLFHLLEKKIIKWRLDILRGVWSGGKGKNFFPFITFLVFFFFRITLFLRHIVEQIEWRA